MGFLRFLLAFSVIAAHSKSLPGLNLPNGAIAVQAFFIVSGFYMTLILTEKYTGPDRVSLFMTNRFLRLYPPYLIVLALTAFYLYLDVHPFQVITPTFSDLNFSSKTFVVTSNILIFGQDIGLFFGPDAEGAISYQTASFKNFHYCQLIVQGWSLAIELTFYLMAPFLVRQNNRVLLILLSTSLLLRVAFYYAGLSQDLWNRRFFPTELAFFLVGILSFRFYKLSRDFPYPEFYRGLSWFLSIVLLGVTLYYPFLTSDALQRSTYFQSFYQVIPNPVVGKYLYFSLLFVAMPYLFHLTRRNKIDRYLGDLSYPIYINHRLVIWLFILIFEGSPGLKVLPHQTLWGAGIIAVVAILFAVLILKYVIDPIDIIRQKRAESPD